MRYRTRYNLGEILLTLIDGDVSQRKDLEFRFLR